MTCPAASQGGQDAPHTLPHRRVDCTCVLVSYINCGGTVEYPAQQGEFKAKLNSDLRAMTVLGVKQVWMIQEVNQVSLETVAALGGVDDENPRCRIAGGIRRRSTWQRILASSAAHQVVRLQASPCHLAGGPLSMSGCVRVRFVFVELRVVLRRVETNVSSRKDFHQTKK